MFRKGDLKKAWNQPMKILERVKEKPFKKVEYNWIGRIQGMFRKGQRPISIQGVVDCLIDNDRTLEVPPKEWITDQVKITLQTMVRKKRDCYTMIWDNIDTRIGDFVPNPNPNRSKKKKHRVSSSNLLPMSWARKNSPKKGGK